MIKDFVTRNGKNKFKYSNVHITQRENETDFDFKKRIQHETYHFRLANNKEDYLLVKDFNEKGFKRVLIYIEIL